MSRKIQEDVRIAFKVDPELKERLTSKLEWGQLRVLYTAITKDLVYLMENNDPSVVTAAIISKNVTLSDIMDSKKVREERDATK